MSGKGVHKKWWDKSTLEQQKSLGIKTFPVVFRCPLQEDLYFCIEENDIRYLG